MSRQIAIMPLALLSLAVLVSATGAAGAQQTPAAVPDRTTATFEDWIVRCEVSRSGGKETKLCETVQTLAGPNGQVLAQVVIGRPAGATDDKILVEVPAGVWLPDGVTIRLGDKPLVSPVFRRCRQSCVADVDLPKQAVDSLITGSQPVTLVFAEDARKPVTLPLSTKGFRNAYTASQAK